MDQWVLESPHISKSPHRVASSLNDMIRYDTIPHKSVLFFEKGEWGGGMCEDPEEGGRVVDTWKIFRR